jgi:DNA polymerase III delta prime subunit
LTRSTPFLTAITEMRQFLDFLPAWTVVIATTNLAPNKLAEPLQTRFTVYHFDRVPSKLVAAHLAEKFPEVPADTLAEIANKTAGDVRAAKADAAQQRNVLRFIAEQQRLAA